MTKRHINIDDDILEEVKEQLGTTTITETVNEALKVVANLPRVDAMMEWVKKNDPFREIRERQAMKELWR